MLMPTWKHPHEVTWRIDGYTVVWAMPSASLWLLLPAVKGRLRSSPWPPWAHPNCATDGNKCPPLCRGLNVELAFPRGHCSSEPLGTPQSLIAVAWEAKSPSHLINTGPKWRGKMRNISSPSYTGNRGRRFTSACVQVKTLASLRAPPRNTLPCSSNYSVGAIDRHGLLISGLESGKRSSPAAAAGRYSALAWSLGWWIVWHQTQGGLMALVCSLWIQQLARRSGVFPSPAIR